MKKKKRAIAMAAALSVIMSSFAAGSAGASYTDVSSTNEYYSAISELSALNIVEGFDDGEFKPDELVTRAQFAKLVVCALNETSAAASNSTSQFTDVESGHWANGYIAQCVQDGLINGTNDEGTTFDPDLSVTYAQAVKMLVCAAGYDQWSINNGGWPQGYLKYGNELGIGSGVTGASNDVALTRGQCAQMIANTLEAALCKVTSWSVSGGTQYAVRSQMDGKNGNEYESLLTENWRIYVVNGSVTATHESDNLQVGKVNYNIMKTKNYDRGNVVVTLSDNSHQLTNVTDATGNASATLNQYTKALIQCEDDEADATILYIESSGRNNEIEFKTKNYESVESLGTSSAKINIYKSESSSTTSSYKLASDAVMQVNGVEVALTAANCDKFLDTNGDNSATLVDSPAASNGSTDGKYDYIVVTYSVDAVVSEVNNRSGVRRISFDNYDTALGKAYLDVDLDDSDTSYTFTLNGETLSVDSLQSDDVLSLVYDPNSSSIDGSSFVRASVSRTIEEGTVDGIGTYNNEEYYEVNGTRYNLAGCCYDTPEMGYSYTMYLDVNGDIAKLDQNAASVSYAIVDRFYTDAGDPKVRLITKTGSKVGYTLKSDNSKVKKSDGTYASLESIMGYNTSYTDAQMPIEDRIVSYSVNSSGEATIKGLVSDIGSGYVIQRVDDATYRASTQRIGNYTISDSSIILNAENYAASPSKSVSVTTVDSFVDEMTYSAIFAGKRSSSDNSYPFVVLVEGNSGYTTSSQMVIYSSTQTKLVDADERTVLYVFENGGYSATPLVMDSRYSNSELGNLSEGDAIIYTTDSDGYVNDVRKIMNMSASDIASNRNALYYSMHPDGMITDLVRNTSFNGRYSVSFVFGPVISKGSSYLTLGSSLTYSDGVYSSSYSGESYSYSSDVKVYLYDGNSKRDAISAGNASSVVRSTIASSTGYTDSSKNYINWNSDDSTVNWALLRIVDNDVMEIYSIQSSDSASSTTALSPTPEPTATPTPTPKPTATPTPTPSPEPTQDMPASDPTETPAPTLTPDDPTADSTQSPDETAAPTETPASDTDPSVTLQPSADATQAPDSASDDDDSSATPTPTVNPEATNSPLDEFVDRIGGVIVPIFRPTAQPTETPEPTAVPTPEPTPEATPETTPEVLPTSEPTAEPTQAPTAEPTAEPTPEPTQAPTAEPTAVPTPEPTQAPTAVPTAVPTQAPIATATPKPTTAPTLKPGTTASPSPTPSATPAAVLPSKDASNPLLSVFGSAIGSLSF